MASFNWFLSRPTNDIFFYIFNNLPPKFCYESIVSVTLLLKLLLRFLKINKQINKHSLQTLAYSATGRRMKLFFPILFFFISKKLHQNTEMATLLTTIEKNPETSTT